MVDLRRLRFNDPVLPALEAMLKAPIPSWDVSREQEDVCPVITAPSGDWDEYLATLDKKDRHEIRRKIRRAAVVGDLCDRDLGTDEPKRSTVHRPAHAPLR